MVIAGLAVIQANLVIADFLGKADTVDILVQAYLVGQALAE